jgi:hypothetical protein
MARGALERAQERFSAVASRRIYGFGFEAAFWRVLRGKPVRGAGSVLDFG